MKYVHFSIVFILYFEQKNFCLKESKLKSFCFYKGSYYHSTFDQLHDRKKRKDSQETRTVLLIFLLNLKYLGWPYREYIKTTRNGGFCEGLHSENDFKAVLANFCCYDYDANNSEAVQNIAADQKGYCKCSSCVTVC